MRVIFIPKPGIDLYHTFIQSETSRLILRFYAPRRRFGGVVEVPVSTLGSGLSLASELRWYIRRYTRDFLIKTGDGHILSHKLAKEIYERNLSYPGGDWEFSYICKIPAEEGITTLSVLCIEDEAGKEHEIAGFSDPACEATGDEISCAPEEKEDDKE
ncbi:hypothetical protein FTO68_02955 [Methanocalculus taiwanensis]|uniref:Uncharacterized protein n=1 Tax=Methanocalculus taiwanensis TaxID=106207 RepID=A0ABD4TG53_9EURY|nr:DUF5804 family protein [Methanocalculus taiwanensis]MCQ1537949.1 hypothetical protein [Methanocalculus taiwanensis]